VASVGVPGSLLGVFDDPTLRDEGVVMKPGDALVLYTDGLVGRREGQPKLAQLRAEFASAASSSAAELVKLIEIYVASMPSREGADDVAVLVLKIPATS
jgi:serine phosphatase RsbU (regulator of sigma subunit)